MVGFDGCLMEFWWNFDGFCRVWWMFDRFLMEFWWIWDRCSWILDGFGCFYGNFSLGLMNGCSWTWLVLMDFEVSSPHFIHWWIITIFMDLRWGCHSPIFRQPKKMRGLIYDMYIYIYCEFHHLPERDAIIYVPASFECTDTWRLSDQGVVVEWKDRVAAARGWVPGWGHKSRSITTRR